MELFLYAGEKRLFDVLAAVTGGLPPSCKS